MVVSLAPTPREEAHVATRRDLRRGGALQLIVAVSVIVFACSAPEPAPPVHGGEGVAESVRSAFAEPRHIDRAAELSAALARLGPDNLRETRAVYDEHMAGLARGEVRLFVSAWCAFDLPAALDWARSILFETQREEALGIIVHEWAAQEPLEARFVAEELVIPGKRRVAAPMVRLVRGWVHHPNGGVDEFLLDRSAREELVSAAVQEIYRVGGSKGVMAWFDSFVAQVDEPEVRWKVFRKTVRTIAYRDPESAAGWVVERYSPDGYGRDGPEILSESWIRRDPDQAVAWLREEAPESVRAESLERAFRGWLLRDYAKANNWLSPRMDDPFLRPAIIASAKNAIRQRRPDEAIRSCERIPASDLLQSCLHAVAAVWYGWDPEAAGEWLETSELSPDLRESVRSTQQKFPKAQRG